MINLNKLKEIDNSILNNAKDKEVLLNDYSTALSQLDKINEKFKICLDLVLNLDEATELISKIAKKTNREFFTRTLLESTGNLLKFIQIRKELITKAYHLVEKNNTIKDFIENYPDILMFNHNSHNISILEADINAIQASQLETKYHLISAQNRDDLSGLGYLFFSNYKFKSALNERVEKVDNNNELFEEINNTYPAFLNDFNKTLETLNHELKEAGILLKEYTETSRKIYNTYDKYND